MRLLLLSVLCLTLPGCATYTDETSNIRNRYLGGQYEAALAEIESSSLKDEQRSALLYHLERSMILDRLGEAKKSRKDLMTAGKISEELYTVSISKTAASFLVNDGTQDYDGEIFEKISIHTMLALSFIGDGDFKSARIEAKKINSRLYEITQDLGDKNNSYREDAFARFLAGLIYEARGEYDDAIIDYRKATGIYTSKAYRTFFQGQVPKELVESLYGLALKRGRAKLVKKIRNEFPDLAKQFDRDRKKEPDTGDLVVIHEVGHVAIKKAKEFVFPFGKQIIRFSFPYISRSRHHRYGNSGIETDVTGFVRGSNVADMNAIAYSCLEDRRGRMLLKGGARLLLKGQLTEKAHEQFGPLGGIAANVFSAVTETADTRSWTLLPEAFYLTRVRLPAGKHKVILKTAGKMGQVETVNIRPGKLVLLRAIDR